MKIWLRAGWITFLVAFLPAAASPQNPAGKPRVAPAQVVEQVRDYRIGDENLRLGHFWNGIELYAAILADLDW